MRRSVSVSSQLSALSSQLSALSSQLSALSSQLSALSSQLSALSSQLSALSSQLSALSSQLSALSSQLSALSSQLSALSSQLSALSSQLSALSSQLSALSSQLSALSSQLSALSSQLSAWSPIAHDVIEYRHSFAAVRESGIGPKRTRHWPTIAAALGVRRTWLTNGPGLLTSKILESGRGQFGVAYLSERVTCPLPETFPEGFCPRRPDKPILRSNLAANSDPLPSHAASSKPDPTRPYGAKQRTD